MSKPFDHEEKLAVGIVQTTLDAGQAWQPDAGQPKMSAAQDEYVWLEICRAMRSFQDGGLRPQLAVFPELSLPRTRLADFERLVAALNVIAFVGADYRLDYQARIAQNQGIVFVPRGFFRDRPSRYCSKIVFGKTYAAPKEQEKLEGLNPPWSFQGDHNVYVFDCEKYGCIGVSICYDFMDIERALMYRGKIQHLFVLAYNRDLGMFRSLADSLSRTVFCNVVVCNTGYFGGSVAVSPYYEAHRRTLYLHEGKGLFATQVVELPVRGLVRAQREKPLKFEVKSTIQEFKQPPPGLHLRSGRS
jgi:predicted amidohydrolase